MAKIKEIFRKDEKERVDVFIARHFPEFSRSEIQRFIEENKITVNQKQIKPNYRLTNGDLIEGKIEKIKSEVKLDSENIALDIVFENNDVVVINKPAGLVVHPGAGNSNHTLVNALLHHYPKIANIVKNKEDLIEKQRPGIIHRLDKDTSGIIVVAKTDKALSSISKQIQNRTVVKNYLALCYGWPSTESGRLINKIGRDPKNRQRMAEIGEIGKEAITSFKVLNYLQDSKVNKISLIEFNIKTGRTHQIRLQTKISRHPVLGDSVYCSKESLRLSKLLGVQRQLLHAKSIDFFLPGETKMSHFEAPLPTDFQQILDMLVVSP